jgi:hypothetical protein
MPQKGIIIRGPTDFLYVPAASTCDIVFWPMIDYVLAATAGCGVTGVPVNDRINPVKEGTHDLFKNHPKVLIS